MTAPLAVRLVPWLVAKALQDGRPRSRRMWTRTRYIAAHTSVARSRFGPLPPIIFVAGPPTVPCPPPPVDFAMLASQLQHRCLACARRSPVVEARRGLSMSVANERRRPTLVCRGAPCVLLLLLPQGGALATTLTFTQHAYLVKAALWGLDHPTQHTYTTELLLVDSNGSGDDAREAGHFEGGSDGRGEGRGAQRGEGGGEGGGTSGHVRLDELNGTFGLRILEWTSNYGAGARTFLRVLSPSVCLYMQCHTSLVPSSRPASLTVDYAAGLKLNGKRTPILGFANHDDVRRLASRLVPSTTHSHTNAAPTARPSHGCSWLLLSTCHTDLAHDCRCHPATDLGQALPRLCTPSLQVWVWRCRRPCMPSAWPS
jgi:hypothetical protein